MQGVTLRFTTHCMHALADSLCQGLHDGGVGVEQVVAGHACTRAAMRCGQCTHARQAWLARHTGRDDNDIRALERCSELIIADEAGHLLLRSVTTSGVMWHTPWSWCQCG